LLGYFTCIFFLQKETTNHSERKPASIVLKTQSIIAGKSTNQNQEYYKVNNDTTRAEDYNLRDKIMFLTFQETSSII
jgi:hypothetical protein